MRLVLVLMAVLGLLASPAAAAAVAPCRDHAGAMMAGMPMPAMAAMDAAGAQKSDPCCDPANHRGAPKHDAKSCLQACAAMGGFAVALPSGSAPLVASAVHAAPPPTRVASLTPRAPGPLERPPRPIA